MNNAYTWGFIAAVVVFSSAGDVLLAKAMQQTGDLGAIRRRDGLGTMLKAVLFNPWFGLGIAAMAAAYFSMLGALSWNDLSLIAPATASLTFVFSAVAAKFFLREDVNRSRWIAVLLVCVGVFLLAQ